MIYLTSNQYSIPQMYYLTSRQKRNTVIYWNTVYGILFKECTLCHAVYTVYSTGCCVYGIHSTGYPLWDTLYGIHSTEYGYDLRDTLNNTRLLTQQLLSVQPVRRTGTPASLYYKIRCLYVCVCVCVCVCLSFGPGPRSSSNVMKLST